MADFDLKGDLLAQGMNCVVRIDMNDAAGSNPIKVGAVSSYSARKNVSVNRAEVLGEILPMSLDATGVSVNISLRGFIPVKDCVGTFANVRGGGKHTLKAFNPDDEKLVDTKLATKFSYVDLYDEKHGCIIGYSNYLIVSSYSDNSSGKGYVEADVTLEGIGYWNGVDYETLV